MTRFILHYQALSYNHDLYSTFCLWFSTYLILPTLKKQEAGKTGRETMRALKKFPTCNKSPPNTQKIDCESFFFGFPIYFYFSAFVPPMQPSIFFFDGCLAKNGFSACFS